MVFCCLANASMLPCPCPSYAGLPCPGRYQYRRSPDLDDRQASILFDESGNPQLRNVARAITNYIKSKVDQFLHAAPIPSRLTSRDNTSLRFPNRPRRHSNRKRPHRTTDSCPSLGHQGPSFSEDRTSAHREVVSGLHHPTRPVVASRRRWLHRHTHSAFRVCVCLTRARRAARPDPVTYLEPLPHVTAETGSTMLADYRRRTISCHVVGHERICL